MSELSRRAVQEFLDSLPYKLQALIQIHKMARKGILTPEEAQAKATEMIAELYTPAEFEAIKKAEAEVVKVATEAQDAPLATPTTLEVTGVEQMGGLTIVDVQTVPATEPVAVAKPARRRGKPK